MDYKKILEGVVDIINTAEKSDIGFTNICTYIGENCPELKESEDEKIRREIMEYITLYKDSLDDDEYKSWIAWLEKQDKSSDQIHYWTEEEIEPIISDYLRGAEHYGGMIGRLRCLKPKPLEKQGTPYTKSDVDDAYLKGISDAKNELEKQCKQNYLNYENINIQQKDFAPKPKETVKEAESNLTPLERKVKDILFSFHINAADGISFDGTMAIVHNLITLCQQGEQKPAWNEEDEKMCQETIDWFEKKCFPYALESENPARESIKWLKSLKQRIKGEEVMAQYIDKSALVAEIERRIKGLKDCHADTVAGYNGEISGLKRLLSFLNTLEVKEINSTDAFVEKACEYMRNHIDQRLTIYHEQTWKKRDEFIEDFKNYIEVCK